VQLGTAGMERLKPAVLAALEEVLKPATVVFKNDSGARELEGLTRYVEAARGALPETVEVVENGCTFHAPLASGQKTGWFYDQAANRRAFLALAARPRRVLDAFSYVGAWGVQAAKAGGEVLCIDSSAAALAAAQANAARNGVTLRAEKADVFDALEALAGAGERFDLVIIDPPAFIKRRKDAGKGAAAYRRLNQLAMRLVDADGLLISCSCSYHLESAALIEAIQRGARHLGRFAQLLANGGQAPDHPVHPAIPESRYLKAWLCRVSDA
jgi:23S rRNA (cytosine1962-C5)-methyltransferase